ncbi:Gldg family protein [Ochrovirga pacifica]|uniref:Gldg family protein n=1 Tax=Ochrovirga pacifica TaxID=1042376 RepID=UPI0002559FD2|nr:Gldg family protein [Ochrovirga pacifica]
MKQIIRIARVELSILFYSPVAWLLLIVFVVQCGITLTELLDAKAASQELGNQLKGLTQSVFGGHNAFFNSVKNKIHLYIPLLTMGLMSRELSSGSIKLLYASPVTNLQIILGKYVAMMGYCFLWVLVLLTAGCVGYLYIDALDVWYVLSGILGIYLLACAYAAIGLFVSGLTSYQLVAAMGTMALLALLNFMGSVGQSIDFVRQVTYWLSMADRVDNFRVGLISSKDVWYFVLIVFLFLSLSVLKLNYNRSAQSGMIKKIKYLAVVMLVLALGYFTSLPSINGYLDTTRNKTNTLTTQTQQILNRLEEPLKMTVYTNVVNYFAHVGAPKFRMYDLHQFEEYTRFLPNLEIDYIPYYNYTLDKRDAQLKSLDDKAKRSATAYGYDFDKVLRPKEIEKIIDLSDEKNGFVRVLSYQGKTAVLRMFFDMIGYPKEAEITAAIQNLLEAPYEIQVLSGHQERSIAKKGDKDYLTILNTLNYRSSLINQGFQLNEVLVDSVALEPKENKVLLVADPMEAYEPQQLEKIRTYLRNGGHAIFATEPGKISLLMPVLKEIGVQVSEGVVLQKSKDYKPDLVLTHLDTAAFSEGFSITSKKVISLSRTTTIKVKDTLGFQAFPLLTSASDSLYRLPDEHRTFVSDSLAFNQALKVTQPLVFAWGLKRNYNGKSQRIAVLGDADFMSNKEVNRGNVKAQENATFVKQLFRWFSGGKYPVDVQKIPPIDNKITGTQTEIQNTKLLFLFGGGGSILLLGSFVLWQRKRK